MTVKVFPIQLLKSNKIILFLLTDKVFFFLLVYLRGLEPITYYLRNTGVNIA